MLYVDSLSLARHIKIFIHNLCSGLTHIHNKLIKHAKNDIQYIARAISCSFSIINSCIKILLLLLRRSNYTPEYVFFSINLIILSRQNTCTFLLYSLSNIDVNNLLFLKRNNVHHMCDKNNNISILGGVR